VASDVDTIVGILQWFGIPKLIVGLIMGAGAAIWSALRHLEAPYAFLVGLATFCLVLLIIVLVTWLYDRYRKKHVQTHHTPDTQQTTASTKAKRQVAISLRKLRIEINEFHDLSESIAKRAADTPIGEYVTKYLSEVPMVKRHIESRTSPIEASIQYLLSTRWNPELQRLWDGELNTKKKTMCTLLASIQRPELDQAVAYYQTDALKFDENRVNSMLAQKYSTQLTLINLSQVTDSIRKLEAKKLVSKKAVIDKIDALLERQ